ncbi:hypothetical protein T265_09873 [Opisthorchis viverrini]|uniref:Uncharacterized protein n=1 Tax=Opisthorchis viverrini TaxID=6198 RepID=A0A074ZFA7_OPIVI|nr:hypothetical protein T265_09873 [Opisthorchis viverrini]KER21920.1 hypothetical protein T265_09873 [Opisthorchis viverrini]
MTMETTEGPKRNTTYHPTPGEIECPCGLRGLKDSRSRRIGWREKCPERPWDVILDSFGPLLRGRDGPSGLGNLAVSQPSCLLRVAWQVGTERGLQLDDFYFIDSAPLKPHFSETIRDQDDSLIPSKGEHLNHWTTFGIITLRIVGHPLPQLLNASLHQKGRLNMESPSTSKVPEGISLLKGHHAAVSDGRPLALFSAGITTVVTRLLSSLNVGPLTQAREFSIREHQLGFCHGSGCVDHIFTLRQVTLVRTYLRTACLSELFPPSPVLYGNDREAAVYDVATKYTRYWIIPSGAQSLNGQSTNLLTGRSLVRTRSLSLDFLCLGFGNLAVLSRPSTIFAGQYLNTSILETFRRSHYILIGHKLEEKWTTWTSLLGQPGTIPALMLPSGGMTVRHRKGATAERFQPIVRLYFSILSTEMGILDKIAEIENEIARTQKNKATEYHLGLLKAKLAKYRSQLLETQEKSSGKVKYGSVITLTRIG